MADNKNSHWRDDVARDMYGVPDYTDQVLTDIRESVKAQTELVREQVEASRTPEPNMWDGFAGGSILYFIQIVAGVIAFAWAWMEFWPANSTLPWMLKCFIALPFASLLGGLAYKYILALPIFYVLYLIW